LVLWWRIADALPKKGVPMGRFLRGLVWYAVACLALAGCGSSGSASTGADSNAVVPVVDSSTGFLAGSRLGNDSVRAAVVATLRDSTLKVELSFRRADTVWRYHFKAKPGIVAVPLELGDSSSYLSVRVGDGRTTDSATCYNNGGTANISKWTPTSSSGIAGATISGWGITRVLSHPQHPLCGVSVEFSIFDAPVKFESP